MRKVTTDEVREQISKNNGYVTVVDSRNDQEWGQAEVKGAGALRIPSDKVSEHIADVSKDDYVVVYCT